MTSPCTPGALLHKQTKTFSDSFRNQVTFLLTGDKASGVNTTPNRKIIDSSTYGNSVTLYNGLNSTTGAASQSSFGPYSPTDGTYLPNVHGGSLTFSANPDNIRIAAPAALGTGDFTIECWIWLPATISGSTKSVFALSNAANQDLANLGFNACMTINRQLQFYTHVTKVTSVGVVPIQQWTHIAWVKSGSYINLYINGAFDSQNAANNLASYGLSGSYPVNYGQGVYYVNKGPNNADGMVCSIADLRLSNIARYTGNFAVPTQPVVADSNTHVLLRGTNANLYDPRAQTPYTFVGSASIAGIGKNGTASMYFNGTTDYIRLNMNPSILRSQTEDFTWEAWVYPTRSNVGQFCWNSDFQVILQQNTLVPTLTNQYSYYASGPALTLNTWNHVAAVRNGSTLKVYTNGVSGTAYTFAGAFTASVGYVGCSWQQTGQFQGYMDDIRLTTGAARYTANFTPPTAPLVL